MVYYLFHWRIVATISISPFFHYSCWALITYTSQNLFTTEGRKSPVSHSKCSEHLVPNRMTKSGNKKLELFTYYLYLFFNKAWHIIIKMLTRDIFSPNLSTLKISMVHGSETWTLIKKRAKNCVIIWEWKILINLWTNKIKLNSENKEAIKNYTNYVRRMIPY